MREEIRVATSSSSSSTHLRTSSSSSSSSSWAKDPRSWNPASSLEVSCLVLANPVFPLADVVWTYLRGYGVAVRAQARSQRVDRYKDRGYKLSLDLDPTLLTVTEPNLTIAVSVLGGREERLGGGGGGGGGRSESLWGEEGVGFVGASSALFAPSGAYKDEFTLVYSYEPRTICPSSIVLQKGK